MFKHTSNCCPAEYPAQPIPDAPPTVHIIPDPPPNVQPAASLSFPHPSPVLPAFPNGNYIRCPIDDCCQIFRRLWALNRHMDIIHRRRPPVRPVQTRENSRVLYVPGRKSSNNNLIYNGNRYCLDKRRNDRTYWRCVAKKCYSRVTIRAGKVLKSSPHISHPPTASFRDYIIGETVLEEDLDG
ncbi:hypothetical protein ACHWQZ_G001474 [Mnemiopsis leidyi]